MLLFSVERINYLNDGPFYSIILNRLFQRPDFISLLFSPFWSVSFLICLQLVVTCIKCQWNDESFKMDGETAFLLRVQSLYDKIIYSFDPSNLCELLCNYFLSFYSFLSFGLFVFAVKHLSQTIVCSHKLKFKSIRIRRCSCFCFIIFCPFCINICTSVVKSFRRVNF